MNFPRNQVFAKQENSKKFHDRSTVCNKLLFFYGDTIGDDWKCTTHSLWSGLTSSFSSDRVSCNQRESLSRKRSMSAADDLTKTHFRDLLIGFRHWTERPHTTVHKGYPVFRSRHPNGCSLGPPWPFPVAQVHHGPLSVRRSLCHRSPTIKNGPVILNSPGSQMKERRIPFKIPNRQTATLFYKYSMVLITAITKQVHNPASNVQYRMCLCCAINLVNIGSV